MWSSILSKGRSLPHPSEWAASDSSEHHRFSQLCARNEHEISHFNFSGNLFGEDKDNDNEEDNGYDVPVLKMNRVKQPPGMWYYVSR